MRHQAIYNTHPNAQGIRDELAYDKDNNPIVLDEAKVKVEQDRLQAAEPIRLLRSKRNVLLAETDWTGLADSALTSEVSAQWKLYRQRLRDLPSGLNTPAKVKAAKWPTKPV
jgi:hypothetical protein